MYIIKNALLNIGRNKGRNILLAAVLFVILFAAAVSIVVSASTAQLIERQKSLFGVPLILVRDNQSAPADAPPLLSAQEFVRFADSELLLKSQITVFLSGYLENLQPVGTQNANEGKEVYKMANASLRASSRKEISDEFTSGLRRIVQGGLPEDADQCVVTQDLASLNGLKIGDTVTLTVLGDGDLEESAQENSLALRIAGIYEDQTENEFPERALLNRRNEIYVDFNTFIQSKVFLESGGIATAQFVLKDPDSLDSFIEEMRNKGLPSYYGAKVDTASYQKITKPLEGMKQITATMTVAVTVFGAAILLILSILSIRERKYEIGVLRAMGLKKTKVSAGLVTETAGITIVCLALAIGAASVLSKPIGTLLLNTQTESQSEVRQNDANDQGDKILGMSGEMSAAADAADLPEFAAALDGESAAYIILLALLLTLVSSLAGVVFVTRFEPMKILSERN